MPANTTENVVSPGTDRCIGPNVSYGPVLRRYDLDFEEGGTYLQVGSIWKAQGWILHLSVVRSQVMALCDAVLPLLIRYGVPFKLVKDYDTCRMVLDGNLGNFRLGKVMSVFPETDDLAVEISRVLIDRTKDFVGPRILTDAQLEGIVYTRYGAFNPVERTDDTGRRGCFMPDQSGNLVKDVYTIPFHLPEGISWPFTQSLENAPDPKESHNFIAYRPTTLLKVDPKGSVFKGIYVKRLWVRPCVIKQARMHMWSDDTGRDMAARLRWQLTVYEDLGRKVPMPALLDLFELHGDTYLAMEYIKGATLSETLNTLNPNCLSWGSLELESKRKIVQYLIQVIDIVDAVHQCEYVHRDITPANFMVDKRERVILIDNELAWSAKRDFPTPPFAGGSEGFMAEEQKERMTPTIKEDLYGLGATMILVFANLHPTAFTHFKPYDLETALRFFSEDRALARMIVNCLHPGTGPARRLLADTRIILTDYQQRLVVRSVSRSSDRAVPASDRAVPVVARERLFRVITRSIHGLTVHPTVLSNGYWLSRVQNNDDQDGGRNETLCRSVGLYEGITGVLYLLAKARLAGIDTGGCDSMYDRNWQHIRHEVMKSDSGAKSGLYGGTAGIALTCYYGVRSGYLTDGEETRSCLAHCFEGPVEGLSLAIGLAGRGLAMLRCRSYLDLKSADRELGATVEVFVRSYRKDLGGWMEPAEGYKRPGGNFGMSNGNSGILYFLLEIVRMSPEEDLQMHLKEDLQKFLREALMGIQRTVSRIRADILKQGLRKMMDLDPCFADEIQGVVIVLLSAWDVMGIKDYLSLAESILNAIPTNILHNNFTQDFGMPGLGELYLAAHKASGNPKWLVRATWIANVVLETCNTGNADGYWWSLRGADRPTADLMTGNGGIIHFLLKYTFPDAVGYRILE